MLVNTFRLVVANIEKIKVNEKGVRVYLKTGEFFQFPQHTNSTREFLKYYAVKSETLENGDNIFYSK